MENSIKYYQSVTTPVKFILLAKMIWTFIMRNVNEELFALQ